MARTTLTVNTIVSSGLTNPSGTTGIADGHKFTNDGRTFLQFENANASSRVVTLQTPATLGPYAVEDKTITIPGSAVQFRAGPFETAYFNRPSGLSDSGMVYLDYPSGQHADITVRAFKL